MKQSINEVKRMQQLAGIIKENLEITNIGKQVAAEFGTPEYIDENSINYTEDEDKWDIDFVMNIPKDDVMELTPEEANRYFNKEYKVNDYRGPGAPYSKAYVSTEDGGDVWIVTINANGGLDI